MKIEELIKKTKAEMVCNRVILNVEGARSVLARVEGTEWVLTEDGEALAKALEGSGKKKAPAKKTEPADEGEAE